jgi:hypothetical protein
MTLGEWLTVWLDTYQVPRLRQTTVDTYRMLVERHLTPPLGRIPLQSLTPEQIQR